MRDGFCSEYYNSKFSRCILGSGSRLNIIKNLIVDER